MRPRTLSRLKPIEHFVPVGSILADVGCDHGLLPILCSAKCKKVIGIEKSPFGAENAARATRSLPNVEIKCGAGLAPLATLGVRLLPAPDTLVLSGMGAELILSILTETVAVPSQHQPWVATAVTETPLLDLIGAKRIIIQPVPLHLLQELQLHQALIHRGWTYSDQHMLRIKKGLYLTTCFEYSGNIGNVPLNAMFRGLPMNAKSELYEQISATNSGYDLLPQLQAWKQYLLRQKTYFEQWHSGKDDGILNPHDNESFSNILNDLEQQLSLLEQINDNNITL
jgi:precorrin-6B methylase 2